MDQYTVEQARRLAKISQKKMAQYLNISENTYINKEKGETKFYVDEALKFAERVNIPFDKIKFTRNYFF